MLVIVCRSAGESDRTITVKNRREDTVGGRDEIIACRAYTAVIAIAGYIQHLVEILLFVAEFRVREVHQNNYAMGRTGQRESGGELLLLRNTAGFACLLRHDGYTRIFYPHSAFVQTEWGAIHRGVITVVLIAYQLQRNGTSIRLGFYNRFRSSHYCPNACATYNCSG